MYLLAISSGFFFFLRIGFILKQFILVNKIELVKLLLLCIKEGAVLGRE